MALKALPLNCTLTADPKQASSPDAMIAVLADAYRAQDVLISDTVRVAALIVKPGVTSDEGRTGPMITVRPAVGSGHLDPATSDPVECADTDAISADDRVVLT